ncbi:MAG TPA: PadR family transcriptional regulator [Anaerolineae bacterium]|nr:PadR family transcriptional regulator [Anaerolineae bacterium]
MSLKHAILGFLSFAPFSGYDLKKAFDNSVQHFWPANQSQIYRTLAELDEQGFVKKEIVERDERLDMKIYSITKAGRSELHQWLTSPLPERDEREPFLIQVYFSGLLTDEEVLNLFNQKLKETEERLAVYETVYQMIQNTPPSIEDKRAIFFSILTLEAGYINTQSIAEWLESAIARIKNKKYKINIGNS